MRLFNSKFLPTFQNFLEHFLYLHVGHGFWFRPPGCTISLLVMSFCLGSQRPPSSGYEPHKKNGAPYIPQQVSCTAQNLRGGGGASLTDVLFPRTFAGPYVHVDVDDRDARGPDSLQHRGGERARGGGVNLDQ